MLQDQIVKPPDSMGQQQQQMAPPSSSTASGDRRSKPNTSSAQVLKCPRCDSLNTKFCYYNNYSLTQPRHFCKNCRRYWTQGGALRNVPVGGGCRKNKRVKQRTLDPGALVPMVDHDSMFLNRSAAAAAAGAGSCSALLHSFGGGYGDQHGGLSPTAGNHSHVLSMAFSRLQESFRLGEQQSAGMSSSAAGLYPGMGTQTSSGLLSLINNIQQQPQAAYDNGLLYGSGVKSEPGAQLVYTGSELGAGGGGAIYDGCHVSVGSATATLASIEDQLSSFGGHVDHHQHHPHAALRNGGGYEAQMMQSKAQQLGLHLHSDGSDRNHFTEDEEEHHGQYHHHHHHHHHHQQQQQQQQQQQHDHHAEHAGKAGKWTSMMGGMHQPQLAMPNVAQDTWTPHPPAMPESLYDASTSADQEPQNLNFWNHTGWADVHPLAAASSAASTLL